HADVAIPLLAREVVGIHALVLLALAARLGLVLDVLENLAPQGQQGLTGTLQESLSHFFGVQSAARPAPPERRRLRILPGSVNMVPSATRRAPCGPAAAIGRF